MNHAPLTSMQIPPEGHIVSVNGMQMYYEEHGEGMPLILLHGFAQSSQLWHPFVPDFAKNFRLIIPDMRGHGRSTNPTAQFTHRQSALDVYALLEHLAIDKFKAVGLSSGGETLIHMATQQPAQVEAMILIGAASYWPEQPRSLLNELTLNSDFWNWDRLRQRHIYGDDQIRALINQLHAMKDSYDDMNFTSPYLSTITAKTLIMYGDRDFFYPVSIAVEMYNAIPNAYLWVVPNGDHVTFEDDAELFTKTALAFLSGAWEKPA